MACYRVNCTFTFTSPVMTYHKIQCHILEDSNLNKRTSNLTQKFSYNKTTMHMNSINHSSYLAIKGTTLTKLRTNCSYFLRSPQALLGQNYPLLCTSGNWQRTMLSLPVTQQQANTRHSKLGKTTHWEIPQTFKFAHYIAI
jgi:hypothetical protein